MQLQSGSTLSHYEIVDLLGKGGMGEVWRARDTRLKREVALKVLPAEMASDPGRLGRFQQEAEVVAQMSHPHIVTIHSVEEEGDVRFLTMELVEGESLDRELTREGMPLDTVFRIGIAVADALAAAHEKHIVHRDLKPANIMVGRGGQVKVLDFGLAKLAAGETADEEAETRVRLETREGAVMGTVPYMSPEQARGKAVDHRSDIFSLGIVLYELVTGRRPFHGETMSDLTSAILRDTPPPVNEINPEAPRHLARIISHCLEKEPDKRFQTARDIRNELESLRDEVRLEQSGGRASTGQLSEASASPTVAGGRRVWIGAVAIVAAVVTILAFVMRRGGEETTTPPMAATDVVAVPPAPEIDPHSIAVLPFVNMSSDEEQEYFSDGISEELLNLLAKIPDLRVTARTSSFSFKGKNVEIPEIARQLHVAHVLEGSVRRSGDQIRITAQLIHAADGFHLWSETYDRTLDDIFAVQDEIAGEVVRQLQLKLLGAAPKARTTDPQAYALYLQAKELGRQFTAEAFAKSDALYRQTLAIDPRYAPAWNGLAANLVNETNMGLLSSGEGWARAREAAEKALAIDPDYAPAHASLGWIAMYGENDLAVAAKHYERALALDPTNLGVLGGAAAFLQNLGRLDEALALKEAIVRRDPVDVTSLYSLGDTQSRAGRYDAAIASYRTVLSLRPGRGAAHYGLGVALMFKGDRQAALSEILQEDLGPYGWGEIGLPMAYHTLGKAPESDAALEQLIRDQAETSAYNIAYVYAYRGEADKAFEWLDKAVEYGDGGLAEIVTENLFDKIHADPRWVPFLRKLGKAPEQLAKIELEVTVPKN